MYVENNLFILLKMHKNKLKRDLKVTNKLSFIVIGYGRNFFICIKYISCLLYVKICRKYGKFLFMHLSVSVRSVMCPFTWSIKKYIAGNY